MTTSLPSGYTLTTATWQDGQTVTQTVAIPPTTPPALDVAGSSSNATSSGATTAGASTLITGASTTSSPTAANDASETASPTSTNKSSSSGVSTGAIAGASVGCLVAGLIIGGLIAFLLLGRKKRKSGRYSPHSSDTGHIIVGPESKALASSPPAGHGDNIQIDQFLLDATPDKELAGELQSLGELVQQHVENSYHSNPVQIDPHALAPSLSNLGLGELSKLSTEEIASLCIDPKTRQAGLQHVVSLAVFGSIDFKAKSRYSMLPGPIASFLQSIPPVESRGATTLALSQWRSLSAFLLHPNRSQRIHLSPNESEASPKAQSLATALNACLRHFVSADQGSQRQQLDHLQAVILECTKLGYEIVSQPSDWRFTYKTEDAGVSGVRPVVVCPGLDKVTSKDGKMYSSPRRVVAPVVTQVPRRMDPITSSVSALHATYQLILFSVDVDQVPSQVRRSLELVQTCHRDLQHLIEIRNECLHLLEKTPIVLNRVNEIIAAADKGLIEVCQIVEKCRPDANNGKVPFKNRVGWVLFDSREFRAQEPVISRHHAAVLSELNFLRQTALLAPQLQQQKPAITTEIKKETEIFDNVTLLGGLMGEMAFSGMASRNLFPRLCLLAVNTSMII
ncbi:hypothetical protein GCG54_00007350 [Colletotrichum gloeosporioides]|uniref:Uncharacterized protein n=1 Tax=Colletotrichum gloeosporioides TaxID=474922 RepID=A0A8H4FN79_COLGL|nr:uncharacterized protein GCG54_00007350 [Colletotrichum gloeosporioides]KAF3807094.1 hypothetical protein GCG54_00007350 [Colletotrichum gloeosporioides]